MRSRYISDCLKNRLRTWPAFCPHIYSERLVGVHPHRQMVGSQTLLAAIQGCSRKFRDASESVALGDSGRSVPTIVWLQIPFKQCIVWLGKRGNSQVAPLNTDVWIGSEAVHEQRRVLR